MPTNYPSSHVSHAQHGGQGGPARRPGSAALDLAWLAAGRTDGFFEIGLNPWDIAAGALLIKEAGGLVTDFAGEDNYLESGHIVAGSPKIFAQLLQAIAPHVTQELKG